MRDAYIVIGRDFVKDIQVVLNAFFSVFFSVLH